jgi:hypothetical protein
MIPGCSAIGQYPNLSLGLPIAGSAKSATIKVFARKMVKTQLMPRKTLRLAKFPNNTTN